MAKVPGIPHLETKLAMAPKQRQNMLSVRVAPMARMVAKVKPIKPRAFGNLEKGRKL